MANTSSFRAAQALFGTYLGKWRLLRTGKTKLRLDIISAHAPACQRGQQRRAVQLKSCCHYTSYSAWKLMSLEADKTSAALLETAKACPEDWKLAILPRPMWKNSASFRIGLPLKLSYLVVIVVFLFLFLTWLRCILCNSNNFCKWKHSIKVVLWRIMCGVWKMGSDHCWWTRGGVVIDRSFIKRPWSFHASDGWSI